MLRSPTQLAYMFLATVVLGVLASLLAPMVVQHAVHAQIAAPTASVSALVSATPSQAVASTEHAEARRGFVTYRVARATRALTRGDTLVNGDFVVVDTTIAWNWSSVPVDTVRPSVGWLIRRPFVAGEVLRAPGVAPAPVITTGATVRVLYQDGSLRLVLQGVATNSAALGAPVGVRIDRNRRLDGFAAGPNLVRLR